MYEQHQPPLDFFDHNNLNDVSKVDSAVFSINSTHNDIYAFYNNEEKFLEINESSENSFGSDHELNLRR